MKEEPIEHYKPANKLELKNFKADSPKVFKHIHCPSCEEEVAAEHINLQNSLAKCGACNVIFSIEETVKAIKTTNEMKQQILQPEGIDLFYYRDELDITIPQPIQGLDAALIIFVPFLAALSVLGFFLEEGAMAPYIPIALTLVALYYIHKAVNYSKNKTHIDINYKTLSIKHRPNNFKKDNIYNTDEIDQLYVNPSSEIAKHYTVHMVLNGLDGQKHKKLLTVNTLSKAKYLELEIERYLNIEDRKVPEAVF